MAQNLNFKRGDTFILDATASMDITGWNIKSQVRKGRELIADLVVTIIDAPNGAYSLFMDDTTDWPDGRLFCDIQYTTDSGQVISTETFTIEVHRDVTQ